MRALRAAAGIVGLALATVGCRAGAGTAGESLAPTPGAVSPPVATASSTMGAGPSPTIGYCGMDPEPVPCVDRADGEPGPTSVGSVHELAGTCAAQASLDRCQALALAAAEELGVGFDQIVAVDIIPNPSPDGIDFAHRTFLKVEAQGRGRQRIVISCPGVSAAYDPPCMSQPALTLGSPNEAYTDVPEDATPFPALDPDAAAAAVPLRVASLQVAVDGVGPHSIVLGRATLPNGRLTKTGFRLTDPWPSDVLFDGGIRMVVTPTAGGPPLLNLYEHGWHPGTEEVEVTLTFNVVWFQAGATFTIVDVLVR